jgi:drug/metabolite transporter (DMT)-like permease
MPSRTYPHWFAVATIALVASVFGCGFAAMQIVLRGGLSVGAAISVRFLLGAIAMGVLILLAKTKFTRRAVIDGLWLGLLLVTIFWLQTDGLRFTTTSKSAFITSLYVPMTPLLAVLIGDRVRLGHAIAALLAAIGLLMLVHSPGANLLSGWNRGDYETLVCAVLCAGHVTATAHFSRRSHGAVLALVQIAVTAIVSIFITALLPAPHGFQELSSALARTEVQLSMLYMVMFSTMFAFWGQSTMQRYLSSTEAAVTFSLEPVVAGLVGVYWLNEHLNALQLTGAALIIVAMLSAELLPRVLRSRSEREHPDVYEASAD